MISLIWVSRMGKFIETKWRIVVIVWDDEVLEMDSSDGVNGPMTLNCTFGNGEIGKTYVVYFITIKNSKKDLLSLKREL